MTRGTHDDTDTFQTLAAPTARVLLEMQDEAGSGHRNDDDKRENQSDEDASSELALIAARLKWLNLIERYLTSRPRE